MVPHPPAKCLHCPIVFPAKEYRIENSTETKFQNCSARCPNCGGEGRVLDGTYDFIGDFAKFVDGPKTSRDLLQKMAGVLEDSLVAGDTPEEALSRIYEAFPEIEELIGKGSFAVAWVLLRYAFALYGIFSTVADVTGYSAYQNRAQQEQTYAELKERDRVADAYQAMKKRRAFESTQPPPTDEPNRFSLSP